MTEKVKRIVSIVLLLLTLASAAGVAFAYYETSEGGWGQHISLTNVAFKLNGNAIGATVTEKDLGNLSRGQSADITLELSATATSDVNTEAKADVTFTLGSDSGLAPAIEVYSAVNGEYVYLCRLSEISSNGFGCILPIEQGNNRNSTKSYSFRLVYSASAGDMYETQSFSLTASARFEISKNYNGNYFVRNAADLQAAAADTTVSNVVFLRDVTLTEDIIFTRKVNIDLNGCALNLAGKSFTVRFGGTGKSAGLFDGIGGASVTGGKVAVDCPSDVWYVQDSLSDCAEALNFDLSALAAAMGEQAAAAEKSMYGNGGGFDIGKNLGHYFGSGVTAVLSQSLNGIADYVLGNVTLKNDAADEISRSYAGYVALEKISTAEAVSVPLNVRVRGTGAFAVAQELLDSVPDRIEYSVFLPVRGADGETAVWETSDSLLLDSDGRYLPQGLDVLDSWLDASVEIGVIADAAGSQYRLTKTVEVTVADARKRTDLIYNYLQLVLEKEGQTLDFAAEFLPDSQANVKAGLTEIRVAFKNQNQNTDSTGAEYVSVAYVDGMPHFTLDKQPAAAPAKIDLTLTFVYSDGKEFSADRTLTAVNYSSDTELTDASGNLQKDMDGNDYRLSKGKLFDFDVTGNIKELEVRYFSDKDYILIRNGGYRRDENGSFLLTGGNYVYFNGRYTKVSDTIYELSADGEYIRVAGAYVLYESVKTEIYSAYSSFRILPAKVPSYNTSVTVTAKLWNPEESAYVTDADGNEIEYSLSLDIFGIYHNVAEEIADGNIYEVMLSYFDVNGNGWIETDEAAAVWINADGTENLCKPLSYDFYGKFVDLSQKGITSLKGLEYFTGASGYNLSYNEIVSMSELSQLYGLKYLNLSGNKVTALGSLSYLDALSYVNLSGNNISSIEPLAYLPSVEYMYLAFNDNIRSISALSNYSALKTLDMRQTDDLYTKTPSMFYEFLIIYENNPGISVYRTANGEIMSPGHAEIVAAEAMRQMQVVDDVYTTLYVPAKYKFKYTVNGTPYEKDYDLRWSVVDALDNDFLTFTYDANGLTTGYVINSPVVNRSIGIELAVREENTSGDWVQVSRVFYVQLLKNPLSEVYIETQPGVEKIASAVVPDKYLLAELFRLYNNDGNPNKLTYQELTSPSLKYDVDLSGKNITDLTGLGLFDAALSGMALDLTGIELSDADYAEIRSLTGLSQLTLGGAVYDFSKLLNDDYSAPFTALEKLYVNGSYNLDEYGVLQSLYRVYLANSRLSIYKDSATADWNPYEEVMAREAQSLPSAFYFVNLNDTADLSDTFTVTFYGIKSLTFDIGNVRYYCRSSASGSMPYSVCDWFTTVTDGGLAIRYTKFTAYTDVVYAQISLSANDGRKSVTHTHYIQLVAEFNGKIQVNDIKDVYGNSSTLEKVFPSRSLREKVLEKLSAVFAAQPSASDMQSIGAGYFADGDMLYITSATLAALDITSVTLDGTHTDDGEVITGLKYLGVISLTVERDVNLGDGSELVNIESLTIYYSGVDFGTLTVSLPRLKTINLGKIDATSKHCRYVSLYSGDDYYLTKFPNLQRFFAVDCHIADWTGLAGLIGNDNFKELYIYGTTGTYTNLNNNYMDTATLVKSIYGEVADETKQFYIGSPIDRTDSAYRYTGEWEGSGGVTELNPIVAEMYADFAPQIPDGGLEINRGGGFATYLADRNDTVNAGDVVKLPLSTKDAYFGLTYGGGDYFDADFAIEWRFAGVESVNTLGGLFDVAGTIGFEGTLSRLSTQTNNFSVFDFNTAAYPEGDIELTVKQSAYDYYVLLVATIGEGYWDNGVYRSMPSGTEKYSFVYGLLIKGTQDAAEGTVSYSVFSDSGYRFKMFYVYSIAKASTSSLNVQYGCMNTASFNPASGVAITSITLNDLNYSYTGAGNASNRGYASITQKSGAQSAKTVLLQDKIISLDGTNLLKYGDAYALQTLNIAGNLICDISGLSGISSLKTLNLTNNLISDITPLATCTALQSVNLSKNGIVSLSSGDSSVFANAQSLTTLDVSFNSGVTSRDIELLAEAGVPLSSLNLYLTDAAGRIETLVQLGNIDTLTKVAMKANSLGNVTAAGIEAFLDVVLRRGDAASSTLSRIIQGDITTDGNSSVEYGGVTYSGTFKTQFLGVSAYWGNNEMSVVMNVTDGTQLYIEVPVRFLSNGQNYTVNGRGSTDYDSGLWAFLTKALGGGGTYTSSTLAITSDFGIQSLKGLEYLTNVRTVRIEANNIENLWSEAVNVTSLTVKNGKLSAYALKALPLSPGLTTLNLYQATGINYYETVEGGIGGYGTAAEYLAHNTVLTNLQVNGYDYRFNIYGGDNVFDVYDNYYNGSSALFNVVGGRTFDSFGSRTLQFLQGYDGASNRNIYSSMNSYYKDYIIAMYEGQNYNANVFGTNRVTAWSYLATGVPDCGGTRSSILPTQLSQYDLKSDTGVTFYLPTSTALYGNTVTFTWECLTNAAYISDNVFFINAANYNDEEEISYRVYFSVEINGRLVQNQYTRTITVQKAEDWHDADYRQPNYYFRFTENGAFVYKDALEVLDSVNLVYCLFAEGGSNASVYEYVENGSKLGWYINAEDITSITANEKGVTSLMGVENFANLKSLTITRGHIISVQSLSGTALEKFAYENSQTVESNLTVTDFRALLAGSKETLTEFRYASYGNVHPYDLSFLMGFDNLEYIYLGTSSASGAPFKQYLESESFRYMVAWFDLNKPNVKILVPTSWSTRLETETFRVGSTNYSRLHADAYLKGAARVLSAFTGNGDVTYYDNFALSVTGGTQYSATAVSFNLPAYIDYGGGIYAVRYNSLSESVKTSEVYTVKLKTPTTFVLDDGTQLSLSDGSEINYEQTAALLSVKQFALMRYNGEADVFVKAILDFRLSNSLSRVPLIVRATVDGYDYERMLSVDTLTYAKSAETLDAKYAEFSALHRNGYYSDGDFALITDAYNTALVSLQSDPFTALTEAVNAMNAVPKSTGIAYLSPDGTAIAWTPATDGVAVVAAAPDGFDGWLIGGMFYTQGYSLNVEGYTEAVCGYKTVYAAEAGCGAESLSQSRAFTRNGDGTYSMRTQFAAPGVTPLGGDVLSAGVEYYATSVVNGQCVQSSAFSAAERGNYTVTLSDGTASLAKHTFFFSVIGINDSGASNWGKPNDIYALVYDNVNGYYYCTFTARAGVGIKVCALPFYSTGTAAAGHGTYYAPNGYSCDPDGEESKTNMIISTAGTYTLYFAPNASVYGNFMADKQSASDTSASHSSVEGFTSSQYGPGVLILPGSRAVTAAAAAAQFVK